MEPDEVVQTLQELEAERSCDVQLLRTLSRRFRANAEEFFPPQIDSVVASFARLGYADDELLHAFAGRLLDVASDASPRRVVRLLRHGAALQLPPHAWLEAVLPQLRRHVPVLQEGLPSVLASLHALRWQDPSLVELLVVRGMMVADELGDAFFTQLFERFSRHGLVHKEIEDRAIQLASSPDCGKLDLRDALNLLAGLRRCRSGDEAAKGLTNKLAARLEGKAPRGGGGAEGSALAPVAASATADDAAMAAEWMQRLALRSPRLQAACCEILELALPDFGFKRDRLPGAVAALAGQGTATDGSGKSVLATISVLLDAANLPVQGSRQSLDLLRAACMLRLHGVGDDERAVKLLERATRVSAQLSLPERRHLLEAAESLVALPGAGPPLEALRQLPLAPLPALAGCGEEADWQWAEVGPGAVLLPPGGGEEARRCVLLAGFGDVFAGGPSARAKPKAMEPSKATPACRLSLCALESQGWSVELRI